MYSYEQKLCYPGFHIKIAGKIHPPKYGVIGLAPSPHNMMASGKPHGGVVPKKIRVCLH
jgi:hypothetical protein